jgi:anti-sigma factor RsiW
VLAREAATRRGKGGIQSDVELTCHEFIDDLSAYFSNELEPERLVHCEAHLAHCPDCIKYYHSYRETIRLSMASFADRESSGIAEMPQELARAILAAAKREKR